ncbi:MAG: undecaprenyl-diphosphate phosphatase [Kastovskya adunca ATA6-11-RM4]|jgi:undecaprenyl-diphosphatase|nr:undecaprenyl-diphosphate phosphatase [Kastovskya adunca ATA6-11-RM4]
MSRLHRQTFTLFGLALTSFILTFPLKAFSANFSLAIAPASTSTTSGLNWFQAAFLGLVQGLTEFVPISSSAHLKVLPMALGWGDPGFEFTAVIQLGSIVAVFWYFWNDLSSITVGFTKAIARSDYQSIDFRVGTGILSGTIPIVFFGLLIKAFIPDFDESPIRSTGAIATASIVMALLLGFAEKIGIRKRDFNTLGIKDGILMGLAQAMALIPGVSRSGSTITAGLFIGLERATAARFSFLLGIPAITLAGLIELKDFSEAGVGDLSLSALIIGTISSTVFSYVSIAWLMRYLQTQDAWVFVWYRLVFGVAILGAILAGLLENA